jgi:hypothetical protein
LLSLFLLPFFSLCSTDIDTAEYLYDVLAANNDNGPSQWLLTQGRRVIVGKLREALHGLRGHGKVYEERVAEALAMVSPPPPPPSV